MGRKASLNLSINAIVVLILAVTMLGLGLLFMKNMMGKSMGQLSEVGEDIKDQMIERIRSSNEKLTFMKEDFTIKQSEKKDYYFGVLNVEDAGTTGTTFNVSSGCTQTLGGVASTGINIDTMSETIPLMKNDVDVQKMIIRIDSNTAQTSHKCFIEVSKGSGTSAVVYAQKYFYITVE